MGRRKNQKGRLGFLAPMMASMAIPMLGNLVKQIGGKRIKKRRRLKRIKQKGGFRSRILGRPIHPPVFGRWGPNSEHIVD